METTVYFDVEFFMPGDKLDPPRDPENGEWWLHYFTKERPNQLDLENATMLARVIEQQRGFKTRLIKVTTTKEIINGNES